MHFRWELSGHAECVRQLGLPCAELTEDLGDAHGLDASSQQRVQVAAPRGDSDHSLTELHHFAPCVKHSCGLGVEAFSQTHLHGATGLDDLVDLGFAQSLYIDQILRQRATPNRTF